MTNVEMVNHQGEPGVNMQEESRPMEGGQVPVFGWNTFTTAIKQWIHMNHRSIAELTPIPRDDITMYNFIKEAPGWFTIMYAEYHP